MRAAILILLLMPGLAPLVQAQFARRSIALYQFNDLPINPGFSGHDSTSSLDLSWFGNVQGFASNFRMVDISLRGPLGYSGHAAWGLNIQFVSELDINELRLRPAYAYALDTELGRFAFGATLGVNYFDFREDDNLILDFRNFASIDGGLGVFFQGRKLFAGISALNLYEVAFSDATNLDHLFLPRENAFFLHTGYEHHFNEHFGLRPVLLFKFSDNYLLKDRAVLSDLENEIAIDFQLNVYIERDYLLGLFVGHSALEASENVTRFGLSIHYLFGDMRLSYGLHRTTFEQSNTEFPPSHLFSFGSEFGR